MDKYGIKMGGEIQIEDVDILPTPFSSSRDEGRIIKLNTNGGIYIGTATEWKRLDVARSHDAGVSYPADPEAGLLFFNTSESRWYMRNSTNTAWITLFTETHPPLDSRDGGAFSSPKVGGLAISQVGVSLEKNGSYTELKNSTSGVLSQILLAGAVASSYADYLNGQSGSSLLNPTVWGQADGWRGPYSSIWVNTSYPIGVYYIDNVNMSYADYPDSTCSGENSGGV